MIHGWPDTWRLWDGQVPALSDRYRCVRFTLPGFDVSQPKRAYSVDEVVDAIRRSGEESWFGAAGGFKGLRTFDTDRPMLFLYGEKKPLMFHSRAWAERIGAREGNRVIAFPTGHWIMVTRREAFNDALRKWLAETDRFA